MKKAETAKKGGKRPGAGRPPSGRETITFRINKKLIAVLQEIVPGYQRSDYIEELIRRDFHDRHIKL